MPNVTLKRFMIFNSSEGTDESREGDKLLYHWTENTRSNNITLAEQIDDICLCDASVNISSRLNRNNNQDSQAETSNDVIGNQTAGPNNMIPKPDKRRRSLVLSFESTSVYVVEVEPDQSIWMAVHVAPMTLPDTRDQGSQASPAQHQPAAHEQQVCDSDLIPADTVELILANIYARFCLINGTFQMIVESVESEFRPEPAANLNARALEERKRELIRRRMRKICENYFNNILPDIHLNSILSNVSTLYNYILYLDLNPLTLMRVNSFINHLICINASQIRHTIVIFNDQLLWSSLNMYDTRILYSYLVSVPIQDALQEELSKEVDRVRRIAESMPIYLTDSTLGSDSSFFHETANTSSTSLSNGEDSHRNLPELLNAAESRQKLNKLYLTLFRSSNNMTLGLILTEPHLSQLIDKCESILTSDSRLGVIPLASLAQTVGQSFLKAKSSPTSSPSSSHHHNRHNHQAPNSSLHQQQQQVIGTVPVASTSAASSSSSGVWRRPSQFVKSSNYPKGLVKDTQKYIYLDRLDVSISLPLGLDVQSRDHLVLDGQVGVVGGGGTGVEQQSASKKLRLIRYLVELEPEFQELRRVSGGSQVEEFYGRTLSDSWLTVTNSKYRTIYSVHNIRNSGLSEAQSSAISLKSMFADNYL